MRRTRRMRRGTKSRTTSRGSRHGSQNDDVVRMMVTVGARERSAPARAASEEIEAAEAEEEVGE